MEDVIEIRSKRYAIALANLGYQIIDFKPIGKQVHFIFANYDNETLIAFKRLLEENKKRQYSLSYHHVKIIRDLVEGCDNISYYDRKMLLDTFNELETQVDQDIDELTDEIAFGTKQKLEDINVFEIEEIPEEINVDVEQLKNIMSGCK